MQNSKKFSPIQIVGIVLFLVGALSIFPPNDVWYHDVLQVVYVIGALLFCAPLLIRKFSSRKA